MGQTLMQWQPNGRTHSVVGQPSFGTLSSHIFADGKAFNIGIGVKKSPKLGGNAACFPSFCETMDEILPLTKGCLQKLGVVQRRMLRSIVGWVRIHDDMSWRDIMVQMNHKLAIQKLCSQWRVGKTDSSDRSFDLHIGFHAHLKDGRQNLFPGIS